MAGSVSSASAATQQNKQIPEPYIGPGQPTKGQQEANEINYASVTLNDTATKSYLNTTAEQDKSVIEQQLEASKTLDPKTAGDFTFDNTTVLNWYVKNRISYHVQASDGTKGNGVLDIYVNPYTPGPSPGPTPHKKASKLTPSDPKASLIGPSTKKHEDAEDIANKLWNKTIKLDPNQFLNKNLQTDKAQFNAAIVKAGLLNANEVQYVSWNNLTIDVARWYKNGAHFTVNKDGATASGTASINASTGETTQQIASKIAKQNINLNLAYWQNKTIDNSSLIAMRSILVNEKILTKPEASVIATITSSTKISGASQLPISFKLDDQQTVTNTKTNLAVRNDGSTVQTIAHEIQNKYYGLKTNVAGQYADSSYVTADWQDLLNYNYNLSKDDASSVTLPHIQLQQDNKNVVAQVKKDGQIATANVEIEAKNNPYIYYYRRNEYYIQAYVNLNPYMVNNLKTYFASHSKQYDLGYFYQMLDDNKATTLPAYTGKQYISSANSLGNNMSGYGYWPWDTPSDVLSMNLGESDTRNAGNAQFANNLYNAVMHNKNTYLSVMFEWEWAYQSYKSINYTTINSAFW